jgi:hypothetical protein
MSDCDTCQLVLRTELGSGSDTGCLHVGAVYMCVWEYCR